MQRRLLALGLAVAVAAGLACARRAAPDGSGHGGEIRVVLNADIRGTNPGFDRDSNTDDVMGHVVEGLVAYREDLSVGPMLAERVDVGDGGRTYTFPLRSGLEFHNGAPVTAADVQWSWQRLLNPENKWVCLEWYDGRRGLRIESVEAPDSHTVVFRLNGPSSILLDRMASFQCLSGVVHKSSLVDGRWDKPVGTGPYVLRDWKRGEYVVLERFEGYVPRAGPVDGMTGGKIAQAQRIRFMVVPDPAAAKAALYSGQVDLIHNLPASDVGELEHAKGIQVHRTESLAWNALLMQTRDPLLRDVRIRRAIAHAVDLNAFSNASNLGALTPNPSSVPRSSPYYTRVHATGYRHDPDEARRLLEAAGYRGQPLKIQTNKRFQSHFDNAVLVQSMLKKVGLETELEVLEWTTQFNNYVEGRFQLMSFAYSARTDPVMIYETFLGSKQRNAWVLWENPRAVALMQEASVVADPAQRSSLFERMHELMIEDVPMLNLYNSLVLEATSNRVQGYAVWSPGKPRLWGVRVVSD